MCCLKNRLKGNSCANVILKGFFNRPKAPRKEEGAGGSEAVEQMPFLYVALSTVECEFDAETLYLRTFVTPWLSFGNRITGLGLENNHK